MQLIFDKFFWHLKLPDIILNNYLFWSHKLIFQSLHYFLNDRFQLSWKYVDNILFCLKILFLYLILYSLLKIYYQIPIKKNMRSICKYKFSSGKYMSGRSRWWIGNPPDPHWSTLEYSRSSFEHSAWLYGYPDLFQSFVIGYLSTLIYPGAFYWIVEHPYLFQSFSLDQWAQLPYLISTYLTLIIFKPNIYIN